MMHYFDCISHDLANCTTETQNTSTVSWISHLRLALSSEVSKPMSLIYLLFHVGLKVGRSAWARNR